MLIFYDVSKTRKQEKTVIWTNDVREAEHAWKVAKLKQLESMIEYAEGTKHLRLLGGLLPIHERFKKLMIANQEIKSFW